MTHEEIANNLDQARLTRQAIAPFGNRITTADAYAIQSINLLRRDARLIGHKIGITSEAVQTWLSVSEPDFGGLLADMEVADGGSIARDSLLQPRIEGEIAFVLGRDLKDPGVSLAQVISAVDCCLPALEIIDSRVHDWKIQYEDTIADNASSAAFVLGSRPVLLRDFDVVMCGMALRKNGSVASTGVGAACLDSPLNAVRWLAEKLIEVGQPLQAGQVVLSGALGPVVSVDAGDHISVEIAGLGQTSVRFV